MTKVARSKRCLHSCSGNSTHVVDVKYADAMQAGKRVIIEDREQIIKSVGRMAGDYVIEVKRL